MATPTTTVTTGPPSAEESRGCVARDGLAVTPATVNTPASPARSRRLRKSMPECLHTRSNPPHQNLSVRRPGDARAHFCAPCLSRAQLQRVDTRIEKAPPERDLSLSGPVSRILSRATIYLGPTSPWSSLPPTRGSAGRVIAPVWRCTGWGLPSRHVSVPLVRSYRTFSPLPSALAGRLGGVLSVALSVGFPRLGVTQHPALRCPDFPRASRCRDARGCPARTRQDSYPQGLPGIVRRATGRVAPASAGTESSVASCRLPGAPAVASKPPSAP
jgi:hypothetical protein